MGKRQRDCTDCGAPVGIIDRDLCSRCMARVRDQAGRQPCQRCGQNLTLGGDGLCVRCGRRCTDCGHPVRSPGTVLCKTCRRRAETAAAKRPCLKCGRPGFIREDTGWCGFCSRARRAKDPPRICAGCGQLRRHGGLGLCNACYQRHPDRPFVRGAHLAADLVDPPRWLEEFVGYLAARHNPSQATNMITTLGRLLTDDQPNHPQLLVQRASRPGRSVGPLARALDGFFADHGLALPADHEQRLAAARRRRRRVEAAPPPLQPALRSFETVMITNRERARRAGTKPRTDATIETALATIRDLACFLGQHNKLDWALVDVHDVEAFLALQPKNRGRRLVVLGQFFRHARRQRLLLADPTHGITNKPRSGFTGQTLTIAQQRTLFRRWTADRNIHPHEALLGVLALLHAASSHEVRLLRCADINPATKTVQLGQRPHPVPLDPASWAQVERCLAHRAALPTENLHLVVTRGTKAGRQPASTAYVSHLLDSSRVSPRTVRCTRLAHLVNTIDPKLVAAIFGIDPQGVTYYASDYVDDTRLAALKPNPPRLAANRTD